VAESARAHGEITYALGDFLDGFYAASALEKVESEPPSLATKLGDDGFADAYLAAVCDHLCRLYQLPRPQWIKSKSRVLKHPYFAARSHGLRMILLEESPPAFRERNIFVSANALSRA
jgi:hypothetical protein